MFGAHHAFGPTRRIQAQALGQPGQRTFRLVVESEELRSALLWLEKEQLQALGLAVEKLLAEIQAPLASPQRESGERAAEALEVGSPTVDFKVGRLALGQDETETETGFRYALLAYDLESVAEEDEEQPLQTPTFSCRVSREQLRPLSREISEVVAAGRPRCPLCGEPLPRVGAAHGCVRTNGKTPHPER